MNNKNVWIAFEFAFKKSQKYFIENDDAYVDRKNSCNMKKKVNNNCFFI